MKPSSLAKRVAIVGGGLAALAGSALLLRKTGMGKKIAGLLGLDPSAPNARPLARVFVHSGTTVMHKPPRPTGAAASFANGPLSAELIWAKPGTAKVNETAVNAVLTISRSELKDFLKSAFPLRVALNASGDAWFEISELDGINYEPGRGIVLRCAARVNYPIPVLPDAYTLQEVAVTVLPMIAERDGHTFVQFKIDLSDFNVKYLPEFVDDVIVGKINDAMRDKAETIAWNASKTLDRLIHLPKRLRLLRGLELGPVRATIEIANEGLIVRCVLPLTLTHETESIALPPELPDDVVT